VWNRLWKGLRDVRAVRWMRDNRLGWKATERPPAPAPPAPPGRSR
jgi:hypothetical protein